MESKRRMFFKKVSILAGTAFLGKPLSALAEITKTVNNLSNGNVITIYHSGDIKGCIDHNQEQLGGLKEIHRLLQNQETAGLLLDAGDFMGDIHNLDILSLMNKAGYHAATLGTHELNKGQEGLLSLLPFLSFPLVNCNYQFSHPVLSSKIKPYTILHSGKLKVGITGVGRKTAAKGISFNDPYAAAGKIAKLLKMQEGCDLVICLSDLDPDHKMYNNAGLVEKSEAIDFIIGKNNTKIMTGVMISRNGSKEEVVLSQVGHEGLIIGKTSFGFDAFKERNSFNHNYLVAGLPMKKNPAQAYALLRKMNTVNV